MVSKTFKWGVLGCAKIAVNSVIPGIRLSDTGEVSAIASRDQKKSDETAAKLSIPKAYGSYEELLGDKDIEAVYIPLPNHLHMEWAIKAAEAGKHVLCEKPIALNAQQAAAMADACKRAGVHLAEAFMYRHHPRYDRIKEIIRSGEIGEIRGIHSTFTFNNANDKGNVRYRKAWGGGAIYDVGCYPINVARLLLETEPEAVTIHALLSPEHDYVDMMASGLVEFPGNVALTFDCGMWAAFRNTLEVIGSEGRIEVPYAFLGEQHFDVITGQGRRKEEPEVLNQYALQADDFARVVRGERPARFTPGDSVANMKVIDACLQSAETRSRVVL